MDWCEVLKTRLKPIGAVEPFDEHAIAAGVLVPIGMNEKTQQLEVLLTKRTEFVETHKNEIGFPGGVYSPDDKRNLLTTALRETEEEIGVKRESLEILGQLAVVPTLFQVMIFPFVAKLKLPYEFSLNPSEVAKVIHLPLEVLLKKGFSPMEVPVEKHKVKSIGLEFEGELIWGASAYILNEVRSVLLS